MLIPSKLPVNQFVEENIEKKAILPHIVVTKLQSGSTNYVDGAEEKRRRQKNRNSQSGFR